MMFNIKKAPDPLPGRFGAGRRRLWPFDKTPSGSCFEAPLLRQNAGRSSLQYWLSTDGKGQKWTTRTASAGTIMFIRLS